MLRRRILPLSSLAIAVLAALAMGGALLGDHVAAQVAPPVSGQSASASLGTPFRPADTGRGAAMIVPAYGPSVLGEATEAPPGGITAEGLGPFLNARGFSDISNVRKRGGSFICEATGPRRERVRLVLDAASGEISGIQVIGFADKRF